ncbi:MAG: phosphatidylserine/phosphatidylglycerophosphate/cardiolipin synthase family protein [Verrucomicrobia bacterium]|nr:phosphatidylserine/phosphatidylglycerophosphate/cardiolipin synthase family protein [Verrucomicrobiota bacterium]
MSGPEVSRKCFSALRKEAPCGAATNHSAAIVLLLGLLCFSGCSTTTRVLAYDNTVQVAKRPVTGTAHFGWRVKTFWREEGVSAWRRYVSFPFLSMRRVPAVDASGETMAHDELADWLNKKTGAPSTGSVQLLLNGEAFFPHFAESIRTATNRIDLKAYIFDNDDVAVQVADLLKARSAEVDIRIIYDSAGSRLAWKTDAGSLPKNCVCGVDDMIDYLGEGSTMKLRRSNHTLLSSEHSKYYLIDDRIAYFGGMNIGREYRYDWRDAMFALTGPVVDALACRFDAAWILAKGDTLTALMLPNCKLSAAADGNCDLYVIGTTPFSHDLYKGQLRAIKKAKKRIYIENPYLWNQPILYQLCAARKRGVDVRVTIPNNVNHSIGSSANKKTINRLLKHGVRVYLYPGMTHVKAAVYDDWACFGSANFDDLSMHKNYELNLFTDNSDVVRQVREDLLENGQTLSKEIFDVEDLSLIDHVNARIAQYL